MEHQAHDSKSSSNDLGAPLAAPMSQEMRDEFYRAVFEGASQIVFAFGLDRRILYVSPRWSETLGYDFDEVVGWPTSEVIHPEDYVWAKTITGSLVAGGFLANPFEVRAKHKNGTYCYLSASVNLVRDEHGAPKYFVGIAHQISDRKAAEAALARSEALGRAVNRCSQVLVTADELEPALQECIALMGEHMDMDLAVIFEDGLDELREEPFFIPRAIYRPATSSVKISNQTKAWDPRISHWRKQLSETDVITIHPSALPPEERSFFEEWQVQSVLTARIVSDGKTWGVIIFCDHRREREWADSELAAIGALANSIGGFIARVRAQKAREGTEQTLSSLIQQSPVGVLVFDSNGVIQEHNEAAVCLIGLKTGTNLRGRPKTDACLANSTQLGFGEAAFVQADGTTTHVLLHSVRLRGLEDRFAVFMVDVTESKRATEALAQNEQLYRSIVDNTTDIIFALSPAGDFVFVSKAWQDVAGTPPEQAIGQHMSSKIHPEDLPTCMRNFAALMSGAKEAEPLQYRALHADGTWHTFTTKGSIIRDSEGKPIQFVGIATDTTERVLTEQRLTTLAEELQATNAALVRARDEALAAARAKGQFLANMSHEIRTPLNGVLGMANLLREHHLEPEALDILSTIQSSGETLLRVLDDILVFSRIDAGHLEIQSSPVLIPELISDTISLYQGKAQEHEVVLEAISPHQAQVTATLDPVRLRQVLGNLVSNAVKFTHAGSVSVRWEIQTIEQDSLLIFEVQDTGIGIPQDRLKAIFESFTQADSSTERKYGGSGLGLAICSRLVGLMGGRLTVSSTEGVGSTFRVELPTRLCEVAKPAHAKLEQDPEQLPLQVLLAEDNPVNRKVATMMLERIGCTVSHAKDGIETIGLASQRKFDLILMDVQMPACDGLSATRSIRMGHSVNANTPIVALTANAMREDQEECISAGMNAFLSKPFTPSQLRDVLVVAKNLPVSSAA